MSARAAHRLRRLATGRAGPARLLLGAGVLASAGLLLLALRAPAPAPMAAPVVGHVDADSSYEEVSYRVYGPGGGAQYELQSGQVDQYLGDGRVRLHAPRLQWREPALRGSWATAQRGELHARTLHLRGTVEAFLRPAAGDPALVHSENLTLDGAQERLRGPQATTTIAHPAALMQGRDLDWQLGLGTGSLRRAVRGRYALQGAASGGYPRLLERLLAFSLPAAQAAPAADDALEIEADEMSWDTARRTAVYRGNVRARRGAEMTLDAERLTVLLEEHGGIRALHAEGGNRFTQTLDSGRTLQARARSIRYLLPERKVVLRDAVTLTDGRQEFAGSHLVYLLEEERIEAAADGGPGRARVRIPLPERD